MALMFRPFRVVTAGFAAGLILLPLLATSVDAQLRAPNSNRNPSVSVDLSVIDALGPPRTVPGVLLPTVRPPQMPNQRRSPALGNGQLQLRPPGQSTSSGRIVLKPPPGVRARTPAPKPKRKAASSAPRKVMSSTRPPPAPTPAAAPKTAPRPPAATNTARRTVQETARETARASSAPAAPRAPTAPPRPVTVTPQAPSSAPAAPPAPQLPPPVASTSVPSAPPPPPPPVPAATSAAVPPAPPAPPPSAVPSAPSPRTVAPQVARATPGPSPARGSDGGANRLLFGSGDDTLNDAARATLDALSARLSESADARVQLLAYASSGGNASQARRLSLSRALKVRKYLIDKGVRSTRIDVRALGNRLPDSDTPDRVDLIVGNR